MLQPCRVRYAYLLASNGTHSVPYKVNNKYLPLLATGMALVYLVFSLVTITQSGAETKPTQRAANPVSHVSQIQQDFSLISGFHLFGHTAVASSSAEGVTESTQPLQLKGVFYLPDKQAHAIIESAGHIQKTYRINDTLPGGAILEAIAYHNVILMTNNGQESLVLDKTKNGQAPAQPESQPENEQQPMPEQANDIVIQPPESLAN